MSNNKRTDRPKKRKFHGNRFTGTVNNSVAIDSQCTSSPNAVTDFSTQKSSSFNKLSSSNYTDRPISADNQDSTSGLRMFDIQQLINFIQLFPCPQCCSHKDNVFIVSEKLCGISSQLQFQCKICKHTLNFKNEENINLRFQFAMYGIGCHEQKGRRFLAAMNMPPPVSSVRSSVFKNRILHSTKAVAASSMRRAAVELKNAEQSDDVTVSCDGTWQRRGFSSKNGISTCLSVSKKAPAKVLDVEVLSNYCDACAKMNKKISGDKLLEWKEQHKNTCKKNHFGCAGNMEPVGLKRIFERSVSQNGLKYTGYLGDGDSKSYKEIAGLEPPIYAGKTIMKLECCGHVQKRMGKRLLDKVSANKSKVFEENGKKYKGIGGVGRLTKVAIKRIQGHYGGAIRSNVGNLDGMKKAIWSIWEHRKGIHLNCGKWCHGDSKNNLPDFVMDIIKPVFEDLSSDELLQKCLHGGTQNTNESFHHLIWERCPKTTFVGKDRVEIAVNDALVVFDAGELGRLEIMKELGLNCGYYSMSSFRKFDMVRIRAAEEGIKIDNKVNKAVKSIQRVEEYPEDDSYAARAH